MADSSCGYCGLFEFGLCAPKEWKPLCVHEDAEWRSGDDGCAFSFRNVTWEKTDSKIEWKLVDISGTNTSDATVEAVAFSLGTENDEDAVLLVGHANGTIEGLSFTFHAIAWDNFIEFNDSDGNGIWDPYTEPPTRIYNMSSSGFRPIEYTNTTNEDGSVLHKGIIETFDNVFRLICYVSGSNYSLYGGEKTFSPFEMKCDIVLSNYERQVSTDLLAINTFIVSAKASLNISANNTVIKKCRMGNGEAFFDWEDYVEINGTTETAPVRVSDLQLHDAHFSWDPDTPVYTTIFNFDTLSGSWVWDPLVGIETAPPGPSDEGSDNKPSDGKDDISMGSSLFACIKIVILILALTIPLFILL